MTTKIAEIADRSAVAAWSPIPSHPDLVVLGSKDSGGIGFEDTGGELEIYQWNLSVRNEAPIKLASLKTTARFASMDWSQKCSSNSMGMIAGGMDDGVIHVWNVEKLLRNQQSEDALIASISPAQSQMEGRLTALKFHPTEPWTLAAGSASGRVQVIDLSPCLQQPSQPPTLVDPTGNARQSSEITSVAWNSQVAHIFATASLDGTVGVWDLKQKKAWCKLQVEHGGVCSVAWNPKEGLYLLTASADDRNPVLKVYDLGASTSMPLTTLSGHAAGILHTSWCPHDETLLLSCSKDNRVLLWDLYKLQAIAELPQDTTTGGGGGLAGHSTTTQDPSQLFASTTTSSVAASMHHISSQKHMRVSATWSPLKRGIALTTSLDRKVQIHSILSLATRAGRPPKWMKPSSCVSTSFGGVVVSTLSTTDNATTASEQQQQQFVVIRTVPEQAKLVETSVQFESALALAVAGGNNADTTTSDAATDTGGSTTNLVDFCRKRWHSSLSLQDRTLWGFMAVIFHDQARESLLQHLGFNAEQIAVAARNYQEGNTSSSRGDSTATAAAENGLSKLSIHQEGGTTMMSAAAKEMVKKALIVGNFEAAVECCWNTGNLADALLLAYCGGADLWLQTQERYLSSQDRPYVPLLSAILAQSKQQQQQQDNNSGGPWDALVAYSNTVKWQETLAILSSYAQSEEFPRLCIALGDRLEEVGSHENASLCYLCALSVEHASRYWISQLHAASSKSSSAAAGGGSLDLMALHELIVKVNVFLKAAPRNELPPVLADLFSQYAQALAEQGLFVTAARYCKGTSMESKILRDRLYRSRESQRCLAELGSPPEFPFVVESAASQQQQQQQQHHASSSSIRSSRSTRSAKTATMGYGQQQQQQQGYAQQQQQNQPSSASTSYGTTSYATATAPAAGAPTDQLPPGWMAVQDPGSGMTYYYNQNTGETTWDRPAPAPVVLEQLPNFTAAGATTANDSASVKSSASSVSSAAKLSTKASMVSKYGDGFVTSASHPELADQYGNIGTSNPYTGVSRPGTAAAVVAQQPAAVEAAPPSGPFDVHAAELEAHHTQIKDTLLALYEHLQSVSFPSEKRQLEESKKGIDVLIKMLSRNLIEADTESKVLTMVGAIANHDLRTAAAIQTALVNTDWKFHKDWLKGIKVLLQLATKKL